MRARNFGYTDQKNGQKKYFTPYDKEIIDWIIHCGNRNSIL